MASYLSIRSKLLLLLMISGLSAALSLSLIGYIRSDAALRAAVWDQLVAIRQTKKADLERYLDSQQRTFAVFAQQAQLLSAFPQFRAALAVESALPDGGARAAMTDYYTETVLPRLTAAIRPLSAEPLLPDSVAGLRLQDRYIARNPHPLGERELLEQPVSDAPYDQAHHAFHAHFLHMMQEMQMYDLFLIDDETGQILYSVEKEPDFATNLLTGPYRNSVLGRAFHAVRDRPDDQRGVVFVDFEHYTPSYGAPAAFLAAPVYDNGDRIGIVAGQVSIDDMNDALTSNGNWAEEGLGATGEVYLVGHDGYARSDSRFLVEDKPAYLAMLRDIGTPEDQRAAVEASGHSILNQHYATLAVDRALGGESGTDLIDDYRGVEVLSAYAPIDFGGQRWAIIAEKDAAEALGPLHDLRRVIMLATGSISIGITIFALLAARAFVAPITRLQQGVERLKAGETHFTVDVKGDDEFATLGRAFNGMLTEMVRRNGVIDAKTAEYEKLLRNVLPDAVADRVSGGELMVADTFENVSIVYAVLFGLDQVQRDVSAGTMIRLMNELIDAFDEAAERHGVEKIKTIGDAYLAACGLSTPRLDHRQRAQAFATEMQGILRRFNDAKGLTLTLSIGLTNGEVDAGIVGRKRFVYEILGECVSEARRLALSEPQVNIRMSEAMRAALAPPAATEAAQ
ncbi:MAG: hypothetical protein RIT14_2448 [Pseudomonadota bacterium]|jgi:class 3 adenylate cyclase/stage V sporulation protein SpoVS